MHKNSEYLKKMLFFFLLTIICSLSVYVHLERTKGLPMKRTSRRRFAFQRMVCQIIILMGIVSPLMGLLSGCATTDYLGVRCPICVPETVCLAKCEGNLYGDN